MRLGLRTEIIVHIVFLMAAALLFVSLILLKLAEKEILKERLTAAEQYVETLARFTGVGAPSIAWHDFSGVFGTLGLQGIAFVDERMQVLASESRRKSFRLKEAELRQVGRLRRTSVDVRYDMAWWPFGREKPRYAHVTVPVFTGGEFSGALQGRFSLDDIRTRLLAGQKIALLLIMAYGVILVVAGIYLLGRNVVRPIRVLAGATREVAEGNLDQRISVEGPAEIVGLKDHFNDMLDALHRSRQKTESTILSLRRANEETREARNELVRSERLASVGHLAAGMAHEIGNPLGAVVGYLELLKSDLSSEAEKDLVDRTLKEVGRIDRLVRDLLDYAAPGKNEPELVDAAQVMEEACQLLKHQGAFDSVRLEALVPRSLAPVRIDRHKLLQVFVNLLINARDASAEEGLVRLTGGVEGEGVWLEVADEGCGMDEEQLRHIFDPFYSTKTPGRGRGLGLSVCHRILEEAGGNIEVASQPGIGSRFLVRLPIASGETS